LPPKIRRVSEGAQALRFIGQCRQVRDGAARLCQPIRDYVRDGASDPFAWPR
jgi:hypothetical protein